MIAPTWYLFGFLTYFFLNRFIDALCFRAGRDCKFDCSKCDLHCAGYVCFKHRNIDHETGSSHMIDDSDTSLNDINHKIDLLKEYLDS